jgi:hypothetical protein
MMLVAATSKTPFYIAGSLFVIWAVVVSLIGINRANFPPGVLGQRVIIAISAALATLAIAMAIATA